MKAIPLANHLTQTELQDRIKQEKNASLRDKYRALLWISQGEQRCEVARRLGGKAIAIYRLVHRYWRIWLLSYLLALSNAVIRVCRVKTDTISRL